MQPVFAQRAHIALEINGKGLKSRAYWNEGAKSNHYDNTKLQHFI